MTRLSNITSFKKFGGLNYVLDSAKLDEKKYGGFTVSLKVRVNGQVKTIQVSRNQLAKLALKLAESENIDPQKFEEVRRKLAKLDETQGDVAGRGTRIKQVVGNRLFKMRHRVDRQELLKGKARPLGIGVYGQNLPPTLSSNSGSVSKTEEVSESNQEQSDLEKKLKPLTRLCKDLEIEDDIIDQFLADCKANKKNIDFLRSFLVKLFFITVQEPEKLESMKEIVTKLYESIKDDSSCAQASVNVEAILKAFGK